ncbi:MAG: hypothetical protein A3K19_19130 [Lentisphaerae bacterium RIFOXYB12_FULL_65_16]|nr:MAG: hypothetical protein A3K18_23960 [Lentisphaerae bacterium RIFOXYA12_64_32]OGV91565.1 MAG: hypothetical protein A3K19_19130 [Lentisphaerae bacterium RIFOXYB12_FULL_65_16]
MAKRLLFAAVSILVTLPLARAADWPMWRCDATRSGASPAALPEQLNLHWTRKLPPPRPAWQIEPRLQFDAAYEPVVAGKTLFLAASLQDTVTAYDAETGAEQWMFVTGGPVRFAPAVWQGRVFVASDDGFLYCLDANTGAEVWRFRGSPQAERTHLGNGRLVSFWVGRGGPVVADGVVYFAAGIWPSMGVYIHALNAETGQVVWSNADTDFMSNTRIDHNAIKDAGLSPQGYMVVAGDALVVPNGRAMPAVFDRQTGKVRSYVQGYRNGHWRVTAMGRYAFVGTDAVVDLTTGREVGSRYAEAGADAPEGYDGKKIHLFEGPFIPYKFLPGCSSWSALTPEAVFGVQQATLYAYDLTQPKISEYDKKQGENLVLKPWRWDLPELWKLKIPNVPANAPCRAIIKAGNRLYAHAGSDLLAVTVPATAGEQPTVAWAQKVPGSPASLIAADDRLFMTTTDGALLCFAAGAVDKPVTHTAAAAPPPPPADAWTETATRLLKATGLAAGSEAVRPPEETNAQKKADAPQATTATSDGYCLVLGVDTGRLIEELLRQSKLQVIAVDADAKKVDALRRQFIGAGLYGNRVEIQCGAPSAFPFPPYLANLIVSESAAPAEFATAQVLPGLYAALRPYGGVVCLGLNDADHAKLQQVLAATPQESAELTRTDGLSLLRRVGPLPGSADWTHETCDAARTYYSTDERVKAPLGVLWYGHGEGPHFSQVNDYDSGVKPQVVGGRLFALRQRTPLLYALDVYTGRVLWTQPTDTRARFASMNDGVYVAGNGKCTVYDPATGRERAAYPLEVKDAEGKPPVVRTIRIDGDTIVVGVGFDAKGGITEELWDSKALVALDRATGKTLWTRMARQRIGIHALAMGDGLVFCVDSVSTTIAGKELKTGQTFPENEAVLLALDARTGAEKWTTAETRSASPFTAPCQPDHWPSMRGSDDWVSYAKELKVVLAGRRSTGAAYQAETGQKLWSNPVGGQPLIIEGKTFVNQGAETFDIQTGKSLGGNSKLSQRHGCNYMVGAAHLLLVRDASASYADPATDTRYWLRNLRSGCSSSLIAADGVLALPFFSSACVCNYPIQTSLAMVYMPEMADTAHGVKLPRPNAATKP